MSPQAKHMLLSIALIQIQRAGIIAGVAVLSQGFVPLWLPSARHTPFQSTAFEGCLFLSNLRTSPVMWTFNKPLHASPRACSAYEGTCSLCMFVLGISLLVRVLFIALLIPIYNPSRSDASLSRLQWNYQKPNLVIFNKCRHYPHVMGYFYLIWHLNVIILDITD